MKRFFLPAMLVSLLALPVGAQESPDTAHVFNLGEVTVFGNRYAMRGDEVGIGFLRSADIQNVASAINWIPGITMNESGMRGEAGFVLRGLSSDRVPLYIDGVPVTAAYDGSVDLYRLAVGGLSKVEVTKSAASLLLGGNTFGPTINLISRKPVKPFELHADVNTLWHSNLNVGGRWGKWYAQADVSWAYDRDFRIPGPLADYNVKNKADGTLEANPYLNGSRRLHTASHDFSLNVKAGYEPNASDEYVVGYMMVRSSKDVPPTLGRGKARFWRYKDWDKDEVYFHSRSRLSKQFRLNTRVYYDRFYNDLQSFDDFSYSSQTRRSSFTSIYDDYSLGGHVGLDYLTANINRLSLGVNYKNDVHRSHNEGEPEARISEGTWSVALEDELNASKQWSFNFSFGYFGFNGYKNEVYGKQEGVKGSNIFEMPNKSEGEWNALIAADFHPNNIHHIRLTVGRATHFANMKDRYSYKLGKQLPNPNLDTEESHNIDITYEGQLSGFNWMASAYSMFLDDVIMDVTGVDADDPMVFQKQNHGKARYLGFEVGGGYNAKLFGIQASYAFIDQQNNDDHSLKFLYTPKSKFNIVAELRPWEGFRLQGRMIAQSRSYAQSDGSASTAGFGRIDVSAAQRVRNVDFKLGILNVTNRRYEYTAGYPQRRLTVYGAVSFDL